MKGISLSSVIQVINLERQSCDIEAQADGQSGLLHFRDGTLVDAMADGLAGEDAAYEILAWDHPEFEVTTEDSPRDRTIDADLTQMLLETARRQDEERAGIARLASDGESEGERTDGLGDFSPAGGPDPIPAPLTLAESATSPAAAPPLRPVTEPTLASVPEPESPTPRIAEVVHEAPAETAAQTPTDAPAPVPAGALNAAALRRVVEVARDGLGDALLSADLCSTADGTSYAGVNSQPAACALINQVTERMSWSLDKGGLPPLGRYYLAELADAKLLLVAPCGPLHLHLLVDSTRVQLGLLLNVILPEVLLALEKVSPR
jgi:hypothetical protein